MEPADHRRLARRLDLYHLEEESPGMIFWHPAGWSIYRRLEDFIRARMRAHGYEEVRSPQLLPRSLWERSGHWEKFGHAMYALQDEDRDLALKPMSCPCHLQIFNSDLHSWRDLPMRYCEFGQVHRKEPSGSLHGLMRSRAFEQDDAHVLCRPDQVRQEVARFISLLDGIYKALGFDSYGVALSLRPALRAGSDEDWDRAEGDLLEAARSAGLEPELLPGEGAFYGPKLEFSLQDRQGRSWQCGTIQLDRVLPSRMDAAFINEKSEREVPVMLHHAVLGSMGRFIGILLEHNEGRLPLWLAPRPVAVLPVSRDQNDFAGRVVSILREAGIEPLLLAGAETLSRRIVEAHERLVPMLLVLGKREVESGNLVLQIGSDNRKTSLDRIDLDILDLIRPPRFL